MITTRWLSRRAFLGPACWVLLAGALAPGAGAAAAEISWRSDYGKARQEAAELGRPLVINLGTDACVWCKQLDARTFTNPDVVSLLNERCVPLKVDANATPYLAKALRVENYPTLVFATPNGKILGYQEGFLEPPALKEKLVQVLAACAAPDWMTRDFQEAGKAIAASDFAKAIALLKNVVEDGKDRPVQVRARQVLQDLEKQAAERSEQARQLAEKGKTADAIAAANEVARVYAGTQAAREGRQLVATLAGRAEAGPEQRARRAAELLRLARDDYKSQQFLCCLDRCELLSSQFTDLPEAAEADQLAEEIKSNPEWTKQACEQLTERLSVLYLALADTMLKKGQPQQAVFYLERIVKDYPNTRHAEAARVRLARLQGRPALTPPKKTP
jgi:tetratricopeptide (TPR) repeat protein